jgi:tetrapyrrole methylase family protein/MazG family protein
VNRPRVVVVGLGPAGVDLLLPAARAALERIPVRYVRTARHPAVDDLAREGLVLEPLDLLYDTGDDFDTVYAAIAARVVEAAQEHGEVVYAVPGSPSVAERTVVLLRGAGIDIEIVPGLSFADLAWNRLGIDPMTGARVVDARTFAVDSAGFAGAMLLAQCDTRFVLSDVKLALLEVLPPEHEVVVLQGLGLPDERLVPVALAQLDQTIEPDHLTSVFVDTGAVSVAARADAPGTRRRPITPCAGTCSRRRTRSPPPSTSCRWKRPVVRFRPARTTRSKTSSATCSSR